MDSPEEKDKPSTTLAGTVDKIIKSPDPKAPDKAQIDIEGAEDLYREIRIVTPVVTPSGKRVYALDCSSTKAYFSFSLPLRKRDGSHQPVVIPLRPHHPQLEFLSTL